MFDQKDFELPLEKQLKMRIIMDEIDHCDDVEVLRKSLKDTATQLATYQQLLGKAVEQKLLGDLEKYYDDKIGDILQDKNA